MSEFAKYFGIVTRLMSSAQLLFNADLTIQNKIIVYVFVLVLQHFWIAVGPFLLGSLGRDGVGRHLCLVVLDSRQERCPNLPVAIKLLSVKRKEKPQTES